MLFPSGGQLCACGCQQKLPPSRSKWHSNECRQNSYIFFAIIKGNIKVIRAELFQRDQGYCSACGVLSIDWEADHILPVCRGGGASGLDNFQTLCAPCHKSKTHSFPHHSAISSQAASIFCIRVLNDVGEHSISLLNTSNEKHNLLFAGSSFEATCNPT